MYYNPLFYYDNFYPYFENYTPVDKPPTLYSFINASLNFGQTEKVSISDFAAQGRSLIFDFDYTLSTQITKADFEKLFIDHFLERRIGFETLLSFKIHLRSKLREILPYYNKLLDSLADLAIIYNEEYTKEIEEEISEEGEETLDRDTLNTIVTDGDKTETGTVTFTGTDGNTIATATKFSDTPQGQLQYVANDNYLTDYTLQNVNETETKNLTDTYNKAYGDDTTVTNTGADDYTKNSEKGVTRGYTETVTKTLPNQLENYQKYMETKESILTLILKDLEDLFLLVY